MNCVYHTEEPAVAYCRTCGKPLCAACRREAYGTVFCEEHLPAVVKPAASAGARPSSVVARECSPGLACFLGFIPGVGAIYNGQYAKGLVHAIIFGLLVSIQASDAAGGLEPLFGILIAVWIFYMALEAYHTCKRRRAGEAVDEFSSLVNLHGRGSGFPVGAVVLIVLGVILLLNTVGILEFRYIVRYWPVALIAAGAYMLYNRVSAPDSIRSQEVGNERQ